MIRATVRNVAMVLVFGTVVGSLTVGCAPHPNVERGESIPDAGSFVDGLTGTQWRLVEIQSMSDEIGTTRPDDPSLYTLSFGDEGDVSMKLNCNRATGTWIPTPSSPRGGSIEFGPLATTLALCPPPSLDERVAKDFAFVRSYIIEGDRLFLSLMADAAIYVWERVPGSLR